MERVKLRYSIAGLALVVTGMIFRNVADIVMQGERIEDLEKRVTELEGEHGTP